MLLETNEWMVLGIVAAHIVTALLIAALIAASVDGPVSIAACVLTALAIVSGVLHATRLLRRELLRVHTALSEAVVIVHRTQGLCLPPAEFGLHIERCARARLAGFRFSFVTVSFPDVNRCP